VIYKPRFGSHLSEKQAQQYGRRINKIAHDGELTAEMVVDDARKPSSPLHDFFEWDDTEAAGQWRLQQARVLVASIEIVREDNPNETTRAYHFLKERYVASDKVFSDMEMRQQVVENALRELEGWQRRYDQYQELASLSQVITREVQEVKISI